MISARIALLDQFFVSGGNFLIVILAAKYLSQEEVAKYAYTHSLFLFFSLIANTIIFQNIMAGGQKLLKGDGYAYFSVMNLGLVLFSLPVSALVFQIIVSLKEVVFINEIVLVSIYVAFNILIDFRRRILYFHEGSSDIGPLKISGITYLLRIAGLVIIGPAMFNDFILILLLFSVPGVILSTPRIIHIRFDYKLFSFIKFQIREGAWMTLSIPVYWAWGYAPVYILGIALSLKAAGVFAALRSIANFVNVVIELLPTYFASKLSAMFTSGEMRAYKKYLFSMGFVGSIIWFIIFLFLIVYDKTLLRLIFGAQYMQYTLPLKILWTFTLVMYLARLQFLHLKFKRLTAVVPFAYLFGTLAMAGSFFFVFAEASIDIIAISMVIGGALLLIVQGFAIVFLPKWKISQYEN